MDPATDVSNYLKKNYENYDVYVTLNDDSEWIYNATVDEIRNAFHIAQELETFSDVMKSNNLSEIFMNKKLEDWKHKTGKHSKVNNITLLNKCCDTLLLKFVVDSQVGINTVGIALREYLNVCDNERLKYFLETFILRETSFKVVLMYLEQELKSSDQLKTTLLMMDLKVFIMHLKERLYRGEVSEMSQDIMILISDPQFAQKVLKVLLFEENEEEVRDLQNEVLKTVLVNMDEKKLLLPFWYALASTIDKTIIVSVCEKYPGFLTTLLNLIKWSGKSMACKYGGVGCTSVAAESESTAPVVQYHHLVELVKYLSMGAGDVGYQMKQVLYTLKCADGCSIWKEIYRKLDLAT